MSSTQRNIASRIKPIRHIIRGIFLVYLAYLFFRVIDLFQKNPLPGGISILLGSSLPYDFMWFLIVFAVVDVLMGYFQHVLADSIKTTDERIIGTITSFNNKLTLSELAQKFGLKEDELEKILADINMQGEYSIRVDKETKLVSVTPTVSLIGVGTKEEKLQRLEELFKEGKISERTYKTLKEKYSKEEAHAP